MPEITDVSGAGGSGSQALALATAPVRRGSNKCIYHGCTFKNDDNLVTCNVCQAQQHMQCRIDYGFTRDTVVDECQYCAAQEELKARLDDVVAVMQKIGSKIAKKHERAIAGSVPKDLDSKPTDDDSQSRDSDDEDFSSMTEEDTDMMSSGSGNSDADNQEAVSDADFTYGAGEDEGELQLIPVRMTRRQTAQVSEPRPCSVPLLTWENREVVLHVEQPLRLTMGEGASDSIPIATDNELMLVDVEDTKAKAKDEYSIGVRQWTLKAMLIDVTQNAMLLQLLESGFVNRANIDTLNHLLQIAVALKCIMEEQGNAQADDLVVTEFLQKRFTVSGEVRSGYPEEIYDMQLLKPRQLNIMRNWTNSYVTGELKMGDTNDNANESKVEMDTKAENALALSVETDITVQLLDAHTLLTSLLSEPVLSKDVILLEPRAPVDAMVVAFGAACTALIAKPKTRSFLKRSEILVRMAEAVVHALAACTRIEEDAQRILPAHEDLARLRSHMHSER